MRLILCLLALPGLASTTALAQSLYKYRGGNGEWVFTDRQPAEAAEIEVRALARGEKDAAVSVFHRIEGNRIQLIGRNDFHGPVQLVLGIDELRGVELPPADQDFGFVVPARSELFLMEFTALEDAARPRVAYRFQYLLGDPAAEHRPPRPYRAPFAVARTHPVSQAYPYAITHDSLDTAYAVDIAMPVGTDIYAARAGVVIDVASTNFRAGLDPTQQGADANIVRILHDDGTYALYAHLNWNGIRVRPGDRVERGEYIADSGNTGFSTGPHLHFVVLRNADLRVESVPVTFEGPDGSAVVPEMGKDLTAY